MKIELRFELCIKLFYSRDWPKLLRPPAGLFVARQALSCLLTLDGSAELLSLLTVDKINSILRYLLLFLLLFLLPNAMRSQVLTLVIILDTGSFPQTCLPCCLETCTTLACHSAVFQRTCPTVHCWSSTRSCMPTSPPTSPKYVTKAET